MICSCLDVQYYLNVLGDLHLTFLFCDVLTQEHYLVEQPIGINKITLADIINIKPNDLCYMESYNKRCIIHKIIKRYHDETIDPSLTNKSVRDYSQYLLPIRSVNFLNKNIFHEEKIVLYSIGPFLEKYPYLDTPVSLLSTWYFDSFLDILNHKQRLELDHYLCNLIFSKQNDPPTYQRILLQLLDTLITPYVPKCRYLWFLYQQLCLPINTERFKGFKYDFLYKDLQSLHKFVQTL